MRTKKIRGRRRQFRRFQRAQQQWAPAINFHTLELLDHVHAYPSFAPWGYAGDTMPPAGFRQEVLGGLLAVHAAWQRALTDYAEPHQLAVWLFDADFLYSRVVIAIRRYLQVYARQFSHPVPGNPPLPPEYQQVPGIGALTWTAYYQEDTTYALPDKPADQYREGLDADGQPVYYVRTGRVWVGTAPA